MSKQIRLDDYKSIVRKGPKLGTSQQFWLSDAEYLKTSLHPLVFPWVSPSRTKSSRRRLLWKTTQTMIGCPKVPQLVLFSKWWMNEETIKLQHNYGDVRNLGLWVVGINICHSMSQYVTVCHKLDVPPNPPKLLTGHYMFISWFSTRKRMGCGVPMGSQVLRSSRCQRSPCCLQLLCQAKGWSSWSRSFGLEKCWTIHCDTTLWYNVMQ